jgi:hypothetical protein
MLPTITKHTKLKDLGMHPGDHPGLDPTLDLGSILKYGQIGLEIFTLLQSLHGAPVGASGTTPAVKLDVAGAGYTVVLDWSRTH